MEPENAQTLSRRARGLYQVTFSDHSMRELNKLPVESQLALVDKISNVTPDQLASPDEGIGHFHREGTTYYRVRAGLSPERTGTCPLEELRENLSSSLKSSMPASVHPHKCRH